jgi:hypothetical protein
LLLLGLAHGRCSTNCVPDLVLDPMPLI